MTSPHHFTAPVPPLKFAPNSSGLEIIAIEGKEVRLHVARHPRARRYVLRMRPDGSARVTIPRTGTLAEARRFIERNRKWLARQLARLATRPPVPTEWRVGGEILLRGEPVLITPISEGGPGLIQFGPERLRVADVGGNLRPAVERYLWKLAANELPLRLRELAALHQFPLARISVRNQKSRWGSCSRRGTVSLNWRLIQVPLEVRDYIFLHELAHFREMNHSARFWREVERLCPHYRSAELWLKRHSALLH